MKKILFLALGILFAAALFSSEASAQMMWGPMTDVDWSAIVEHTRQGEREGKILLDKLQTKETVCTDLLDEQFDQLGEYFMGQMMGDSHAAMNAMMIQMHGEEGEEQIHVVMGKRLSGCDSSAAFPMGGDAWMPMMQMMWSGPATLQDRDAVNDLFVHHGYGMMGGGSWLYDLTILIWLVVGIFAIAWFWKQSRTTRTHEK